MVVVMVMMPVMVMMVVVPEANPPFRLGALQMLFSIDSAA